VVGKVCRYGPRDVAVRPPSYLGLLGQRPPSKKLTVMKSRFLGCFRTWVVASQHLRWANVMENVRRHVRRDVAVRLIFYLVLLGQRPPL